MKRKGMRATGSRRAPLIFYERAACKLYDNLEEYKKLDEDKAEKKGFPY